MECCTFTYRVYIVLSVENQASGYWDSLRYHLKKMVACYWMIFSVFLLQSVQSVNLFHCFVKTADNQMVFV